MYVKTKALGTVGGRASENFACRSANVIVQNSHFAANKLETCFALMDVVLCGGSDENTIDTACQLCAAVIVDQLRNTRCRSVNMEKLL